MWKPKFNFVELEKRKFLKNCVEVKNSFNHSNERTKEIENFLSLKNAFNIKVMKINFLIRSLVSFTSKCVQNSIHLTMILL